MAIPGGFVSHIDLLDPACYSGTGNTITDLANPAASWNITGTKTYDASVGAITWGASTIIELDTQLAATGNTDRTIAAWIKWPQDGPVNPGESVQPFLQIGDDTNYNGLALTMTSNTEIGGRFPLLYTGDSLNSKVTAVAYSPQWTFVAITLAAGQIGVNGNIYLNGVDVGALGYNTPGSPPNITYSSGQFGIYNHDYSPYGTQSSGTVSQHWIYNSVLDANDILALYNDTKDRYVTPITELDFLNPACFNGSGTALNDLSGNGSNFTLNNTSYTYDPVIGALTLPSGTHADGTAADFVFGTNPVSISAWVKINTSVPGINVCYFGGSGAGTRTQFLWRSSDDLIVVDNASSAGAWDFIADNEWHLLTITRPANSLVNQQIVYLDGVLIPLSSSTFNPLQPLNGSLGTARISRYFRYIRNCHF